MSLATVDRVATWSERLSLEDKVWQLLIPSPRDLSLSPREYVDRFGAGGLLVHHSIYQGPRKMAEYIVAAQQAARERNGVPLFMACDHEGGHVRFMRTVATQVPSNMGIAATGDPASARESASIQAAELRAVGVNWNFSPVVDVNNNPENPVIGVRAYSDDPAVVSAFAREAIGGYQGAGLLACAKHFPGHGDTTLDSHIDLPVVPHDRSRLDRLELPPFRDAIAAGVASFMTAHVRMPALDPDRVGTLSRPILTDLLRHEMGFGGIVVTDSMDMVAVAEYWEDGEAAIESILAGCDVILTGRYPDKNQRVFEALLQAVKSGRIPRERFESAVHRLLEAKARVALDGGDPDRAEREVGKEEHKRRALELARKSITLVRDDAGALPLPRDLKEKLVVLSPVATKRTMMEQWTAGSSPLGTEIARRAPGAVTIDMEYPLSAETQQHISRATQQAQAVVVGTLNAVLDPDQVALLESLRAQTNARIAVVAMRMPYDLLRVLWVPTYLCAYTTVEPTAAAVAEVLFGEVQPRGQLPVELPGLYPRGYKLAQ
jgi:beta-N-acetylhexosaminidase